MKIIEKKYNRYGEEDYDSGYIDWGFKDLEYQLEMAQKIQKLFPKGAGDILDMACGIGRYHRVWLEAGFRVTGVDLSETFIKYAREYNKEFDNALYTVSDFNEFDRADEFDVAVMTDCVPLTGKAARNIYRSLHDGGIFLYEIKNENYFEYKAREWNKAIDTWSCNDGVYKLVHHQYNKVASTIEHEEIIFDVPNDTMIHKTGLTGKYVNMYSYTQILEAAGFENVRFIYYEGYPFDPADDKVRRFFVIGEKRWLK